MKSLIVGDGPTVALLAERLKRAGSHAEHQRIQCVLIRATLGSSAAQIAQWLGWSTDTVHVLHSRWAQEGDSIFDLRGRGGRRHQHLSVEREQALLAPFIKRTAAGGRFAVSEIQQAYEDQTGVQVAPSTVYRLLDRHGWRKVAPCPRHPPAGVAAQAASTGTAPRGRPRGRQVGQGRPLRLMVLAGVAQRHASEFAARTLLRRPRLPGPRSRRAGVGRGAGHSRGRPTPKPVSDRVQRNHIQVFERNPR